MFSWWNPGGEIVFQGRPCSGNDHGYIAKSYQFNNKILSQNAGNPQIVMRSIILVTTLILFCFYISNFGIFFTLDEESQMRKGRLESILTLGNGNFEVRFFMLCNQLGIVVNIMMPRFRIPWPLVKCLSLRPYFVTIRISNSGDVAILLPNTFCYNIQPCVLLGQGFSLLVLHLTLFTRQGLRGDHWVLYNYIKARKKFQVFSI